MPDRFWRSHKQVSTLVEVMTSGFVCVLRLGRLFFAGFFGIHCSQCCGSASEKQIMPGALKAPKNIFCFQF